MEKEKFKTLTIKFIVPEGTAEDHFYTIRDAVGEDPSCDDADCVSCDISDVTQEEADEYMRDRRKR